MNIIIFQSSVVDPQKGGINRMSKTYYDFLTARGHSVFFVSVHIRGRKFLPHQLLLEGSTQEDLHRSFDQIVDGYQVDLVIHQDGISPYQNYVLRWAKEKDIRIIDVIHSTLRGMYGIEGHPSLSLIKPRLLKKAVNILINKYFKLKYGNYYREQFRLSDRIVLLSEKYKDEITYFTGRRDFSKFIAIPNPITIESPSIIKKNNNKIILHVGRLNKTKRQDLLLDIWKLVEDKRPQWCLKILGDGNMRSKLVRKVKTLQLKHVEFCGYHSPEPYYNEASIFCLTSAFEGFVLVLVEAMAYGCVPMAFNSFETASDIIDDGVNGLLIPPFNIKEYAEKLIEMIDDEEKRSQMAKKAVEKSKNFDLDKIADKWVDMLEQLNKREASANV